MEKLKAIGTKTQLLYGKVGVLGPQVRPRYPGPRAKKKLAISKSKFEFGSRGGVTKTLESSAGCWWRGESAENDSAESRNVNEKPVGRDRG